MEREIRKFRPGDRGGMEKGIKGRGWADSGIEQSGEREKREERKGDGIRTKSIERKRPLSWQQRSPAKKNPGKNP